MIHVLPPLSVDVAALADKPVLRFKVTAPFGLDGVVAWDADTDFGTIVFDGPDQDSGVIVSTGKAGTGHFKATADGAEGPKQFTLTKELVLNFVLPASTTFDFNVEVLEAAPSLPEDPTVPPADGGSPAA